jgi:hypothetical protein
MLGKGIVSVRSKHGLGLDPDKARLAYHLRRTWDREEALALDGDLASTLTAAVRDVLPALRQARTTAI